MSTNLYGKGVTIDDLAGFTHTPRLVGMLPIGAPVLIEDPDGNRFFIDSLNVVRELDGVGAMVIKIGERFP